MAVVERRQLLAGGRRTSEQLLVIGGAEAAAGVGDPLELSFDLLQPVRLGLEGRKEAAEIGADLAQAHVELPQLLARSGELRSEAFERRERTLRGGREPGRSLALVRRDCLHRARGALGELGHMPQPLARVSQRLLASRLERLGRLYERAQLLQPCLLRGRTLRQRVVPLARGGEIAPGEACVAAATQLLLADEGVEHVELVRRAA